MNHRFQTTGFLLLILTLLAGASGADVLHLKTGGRVEGVIVQENATSLTLDLGTGQVSLPKSSVVRIERRESALSEYRNRLASIQPGDVNAYADLARFANENGLRAETRSAWTRVLSLDPRNVEAHLALGHVLIGGSWVDEAEANRALGLVHFEGRWMTPAEQAYLLREREARADDERRERDSRRAAREEEDRERRAEAREERARAAAMETVGYPVWGYGGIPFAGYGGGGCLRLPCPVVTPFVPARPSMPVAPPPVRTTPIRPSSIH